MSHPRSRRTRLPCFLLRCCSFRRGSLLEAGRLPGGWDASRGCRLERRQHLLGDKAAVKPLYPGRSARGALSALRCGGVQSVRAGVSADAARVSGQYRLEGLRVMSSLVGPLPAPSGKLAEARKATQASVWASADASSLLERRRPPVFVRVRRWPPVVEALRYDTQYCGFVV